MTTNNLKYAVWILILIGLSTSIQAQTVRLNAAGEKIIQYSDGSWRYYQPSDSIYDAGRDVVSPQAQSPEARQQEQAELDRLRIEAAKATAAQRELDALKAQLIQEQESRKLLEKQLLERQKLEEQLRKEAKLKQQKERELQELLDREEQLKKQLDDEEKMRLLQLAEKKRLEKEELDRKQAEVQSKLQEKQEKERLKQALKEQKRLEKEAKQKRKLEENRLKAEREAREEKENLRQKELEAELKLKRERQKQAYEAHEAERKRIEQKEKDRLDAIEKERHILEEQLKQELERQEELKQQQRNISTSTPDTVDANIPTISDSIVQHNNLPKQPKTLSSKLAAIEELRKKYSLKAKFERDRYANAQAKKLYVQEEFQQAKDNKDIIGEEAVARLAKQFNIAKQEEKAAKKRSKKATKKATKALEVSHKSYSEQLKWYDDEMSKMQQESDEQLVSVQDKTPKEYATTVGNPDTNQKSSRTSSTSIKIPTYVDPTFDPPAKSCIADHSIDRFTGKKRTDTRLETLMEYTPEVMLPHLKGEPYLTIFGNLTAISGYTFVNLKVVIVNDKASHAFGSLPKNSFVQFTFIDGTPMTLTNRRADKGIIDQLDKTTTYLIQLSIDKSAEKMLKNKLLDKIKIYWGKGYEEYPINNVDFFEHQIKCLRND